MKNNMTEKIQRIWGKSFATFATFAMQIFKRPAVVSVRTAPVESTVKVAQRSMIRPILPLFATVLMLTFGVGNAWGDWSAKPYYNSGDSKWYSLYDESWTESTWSKGVDKYPEIFPPTNGKISIQWKEDIGTADTKVYLNGTKIAGDGSHTSTQTTTVDIGTDVTSTNVGLYSSGMFGAWFGNFRILLAHHIRLDNSDNVGVTSKSDTVANTVFGNTSATAYHINLRSFLMQNDGLRYVSSNPEFHFGGGVYDKTFAVKANSCAYGSGASGYDCTDADKVGILGNPDSYEVDVYFTPSANVNAECSTTITIYDGETARDTVTLTAKVIPTYYFKATSVATDGTRTLDIPVRASFTSGVFSSNIASVGLRDGVDKASLLTTAYFSAPEASGDYQFQGWFKDEACTQRLTVSLTKDSTFTSSSLSEGSPASVTLYAKYLASITPEFSGEDQEMEVGDTYDGIGYVIAPSADVASDDPDDDFWFEYEDNTPAGITTGSDNPSQIISFDPTLKVVTAHNAGTAKLILHQKAVGLYVAVDTVYEFTVTKKTNAISCSWGSWSKDVNFDEEVPVTFTSDNDAVAPIVVTPGAGVAAGNGSYEAINHKVIAGHNIGSAVWQISQAEDYKYEAAVTKNCTINVGTLPSPGCEVYIYNSGAGANGEGWARGSFGEKSWNAPGTPKKLKFEAYTTDEGNGAFETHAWIRPDQYYNGEWHELSEVKGSLKEQWHEFERELNEGTTIIRFGASGGKGNKFVRNVKVSTSSRYLNIDTIGGTSFSTLNMPKCVVGGTTRAKFCVEYATCDDYIKLVSSNSKITFAATGTTTYTYDVNADHYDRDTIELVYTGGASAENIVSTITVYTRYEHETLTVNATTKILTTTLEYLGGDSYSVDHSNMSAAELFQVRDENGVLLSSPAITLSSSNGEVITPISSNTGIEFACGGTATITATYAGDATHAAASNLSRDITVNKVDDAITWDGLAEDGKIHVLADTTIAITFASSSHTSIASYASGSDTYMTVAGSAGAFTLTTLKVGEVTLTATSAGDCVYNAVSSTKTVVVDPCYHSIIWEQNFQGIQADENGHIDSTIVLNAYAVDSLGNRTSVGITYSIGSGSCAEMKDGKLHLKGVGDATIIATTATDDKYAVVSETKPISVVLWGVNKAMSANDDSDISDGKVVFDAPHARFTFGGETDITTFHYAKVQGKPEGYQLAMYLDKDDGTPKYYFTWESTNANCSIQVTKISFWAKAYTSNATLTNNGKLSFNGEDFVAIGTAALTANDGDFKHFDKPGTYTDSVWITCKSTWQNFDFYIKNIVIEYTVYTTAPSPTGGIENLNATINVANKQTVDVSTLFGYAVAPPSDFEYSYEIVESTTHADLVGGTAFWADSVGDYTVRAKVNADEDHRESGWSSTKTIRVNRVPYIFNNGAADQAWNTLGNWNASWLPTDEDMVIVRGDLMIDREIEVKKLSIESGVVEIAPNGGLTVGAGGVSGATTSNFVLKADSDPESATIGQTGYLRISPDYDGAMPNAKVELFSKAYYDPSVGGAVWQIVGAPIANAGIKAKTVYTKNWVYSWKESENDWYNNRSRMTFEPFIGFETTQDADADGLLMTYTGQLVAGNEVITKNLAFTDDDHGYNAMANSFAAPIAIDKFESTDFTNVDATIYILNSGTKEQSEANTGGYNAAGRFYNIPVANAATMATTYGTPLTIPSMQGFFLKAKASSAQVSFDYSRLVWDVDYTGSYVNQPLRAKKHTDDSQVGSLKVTLYADSGADHLFFLESDDYLPEFENGYDAHKMFDGGMAIYSINENDKMSVDATNSIIGTRVGVHTGEETAYTITFSYVDGEQEWALYDAETNEMIDITNDNTYTFFAEPNSNITERFMIVEREGAPAVTTGNDKVTSDVRAHKFIKDSQLFILKNGVLYDATGARVK